MLGSIDCMHWEWVKCHKALHGQFKRKDKRYPTIMLEAVMDQQLWFWHAYFGAPGANNDLNVLYGSPLFDDLLAEKAPEAPFQVNGKTYEKGYYLADEIYPQWSTFVKAFSIARDQKTIKFKRVQESARKDIERAFGVLQGRWRIIQQPARAYHMNTIIRIMYTCMILHNDWYMYTLLQRATFNVLGSNDAKDNKREIKNFENIITSLALVQDPCDLSGVYQDKWRAGTKRKKSIGSRLTDCPFQITVCVNLFILATTLKQGSKIHIQRDQQLVSEPRGSRYLGLFKEVSTEDALNTAQPKVSTNKKEVSTDRPEEGTDKQKVSTDKEEVSTDIPDEGTVYQIEGRSAIQTAPTTTPTIFGDDQTIAQVLLNMSQAKAISREKEKGVELKDVENIEIPRPTSTRSLLTLKPLLKIDPKDKGKKKIEEDESDTESEDINESEKKFKMLAHDKDIARKVQED
ncbi:ALP1-like protein [Tanacetum coccineum]